MRQDGLKRLIIESVAERGIRAVREDPNRSIRKLVDLGREFARGRFQKQFFQLSHHLLSDENSPYYRLLIALVRQVDTSRLKTFGVNLGWQSWTEGANQIRAIESAEGFQIPWALVFHFGPDGSVLTPELFRRCVREGRELGIYSALIDGEDCGSLTPYLDVMREHEDGTFVLLLTPGQAAAYQEELESCPNLMLSISAEGTDWQAAGERLREAGMLFGFYLHYDGESLAQLREQSRDPAWTESLFACGGMGLFLVARPEVNVRDVEAVCHGVRAYRNHPNAPLFCMDLYTDYSYIDSIISDDVCFLGIRADGTVTCCMDGREQPSGRSIDGRALRDVLPDLYPKNHGN